MCTVAVVHSGNAVISHSESAAAEGGDSAGYGASSKSRYAVKESDCPRDSRG